MTDTEATAALAVSHDGWGELVLFRLHRRNALIGPMMTPLRAGLAALRARGARAIVLRGAGGSFWSGRPLDAVSHMPAPERKAGFAEKVDALHRACATRDRPKTPEPCGGL